MFAPRAAIVLAAGASTRMGSPKALLPWADTTLVGYALDQLEAVGAAQVVVVVGAHREVASAVEGRQAARVAVNPDYARGRSSSIRVGATGLDDGVGSVLVQSVDQPCPAAVLAKLYAEVEHSDAAAAVPVHAGRRGHPICLAGRLLPELREVQEVDMGLRALMLRHADATHAVDVETAEVLRNLNDPAAYAAAFAALERA